MVVVDADPSKCRRIRKRPCRTLGTHFAFLQSTSSRPPRSHPDWMMSWLPARTSPSRNCYATSPTPRRGSRAGSAETALPISTRRAGGSPTRRCSTASATIRYWRILGIWRALWRTGIRAAAPRQLPFPGTGLPVEQRGSQPAGADRRMRGPGNGRFACVFWPRLGPTHTATQAASGQFTSICCAYGIPFAIRPTFLRPAGSVETIHTERSQPCRGH